MTDYKRMIPCFFTHYYIIILIITIIIPIFLLLYLHHPLHHLPLTQTVFLLSLHMIFLFPKDKNEPKKKSKILKTKGIFPSFFLVPQLVKLRVKLGFLSVLASNPCFLVRVAPVRCKTDLTGSLDCHLKDKAYTNRTA